MVNVPGLSDFTPEFRRFMNSTFWLFTPRDSSPCQ